MSDDRIIPFHGNENEPGGIATGEPEVSAEEEKLYMDVHNAVGQLLKERFDADEYCRTGMLPGALLDLFVQNCVHGIGPEGTQWMLDRAKAAVDGELEAQRADGVPQLWEQ